MCKIKFCYIYIYTMRVLYMRWFHKSNIHSPQKKHRGKAQRRSEAALCHCSSFVATSADLAAG